MPNTKVHPRARVSTPETRRAQEQVHSYEITALILIMRNVEASETHKMNVGLLPDQNREVWFSVR